MPMSDAIENLAQDLSQVGVSPYEYPILTDEGYVNTIPNPNFVEPYVYPNPPRFGLPEQPAGMFDPVLDYGTRQWLDRRMRSPNPIAQDLSNPSTLATGGEMDYNVRDQPVERINIGNTDEKDAFVRTGIGTTLDPKTEDAYGVKGLVSPGDLGGTIGVVDANPADFAGQIPSVPQGVVTRGETVGRTFDEITGRPDYSVPIGLDADTGDIVMANRNNIRDAILVPSGRSISQADIDRGVSPNVTIPTNWNKGINTELDPSQKTPTSVGAAQPTTASEGGFNNTGGKITAGPDNRAAGPGVDDTIRFNPDWKPGDKPKVENDIDGDGISDVWRIATGGNWRFDTEGNWSNVNPDYIDPKTGREEPPNNTGDRWNFRTGEWDYKDVPGTTPPGTTTPPGGGTTTTPPGGGTKPPGGGGQPGGGTPGGGPPGGGTPGRGPTPLPPREPVTPLIRREVVIPTKGTKEVPLPDRQADPFAKLYADLLANSQQQQDQYRYINYDPDQIMNAAMSGFRRRGAMRSLQGY